MRIFAYNRKIQVFITAALHREPSLCGQSHLIGCFIDIGVPARVVTDGRGSCSGAPVRLTRPVIPQLGAKTRACRPLVRPVSSLGAALTFCMFGKLGVGPEQIGPICEKRQRDNPAGRKITATTPLPVQLPDRDRGLARSFSTCEYIRPVPHERSCTFTG